MSSKEQLGIPETDYIGKTVELMRERATSNFPGAKFVAVYSHKRQEMVFVPIEEALGSIFGHATDYGSGVFEGSSALVNESTGVPNVVLLEQRNRRMFKRSLPARGYKAPISKEQMREAILRLISLHDLSLFRHPDGETPGFVRAYVRPTVFPASLGGYGINMRQNYPVDVGVVVWSWPDYLDPTLSQRGGVAAVTGHQRLTEVTGKHSSNYGAAVKDGGLARSLGADELIYLAPYLVDRNGYEYWTDPNDHEAKSRDGVISDGPGEECVALTADQKTLVYTPMRTNRLGGTVLSYIIEHMASQVGLETKEADITLHDLRAGKYCGLAMVGNAVKVTPMRRIDLFSKLYIESSNIIKELQKAENLSERFRELDQERLMHQRDPYERQLIESISLFEENQVPEKLTLLAQRWEAETRGLVEPSHPSLLTPVPGSDI